MSSKKASQSPRVKAHALKANPSSKKLKKKTSSRALIDGFDTASKADDSSDTFSINRSNFDRSITSLGEEKSSTQLVKVN